MTLRSMYKLDTKSTIKSEKLSSLFIQLPKLFSPYGFFTKVSTIASNLKTTTKAV